MNKIEQYLFKYLINKFIVQGNQDFAIEYIFSTVFKRFEEVFTEDNHATRVYFLQEKLEKVTRR